MNPQIFHVGDIVEAQVSFIVAPLKNKKFKMIVVLRSIALLNSTFSQVRMYTKQSDIVTHEFVGRTEEKNVESRTNTTNQNTEETGRLR